MARRSLVGALALGLALGLTPPAVACSTFCLRDDGRLLFGKNYDWMVPDGLMFVNPRDMAKVALSDVDAARWTSRYGSVTFNQYGRDFPSGGINEAGLVIELMWLDGSKYPAPDERRSVGVLSWIQYQLDTAASVADVLASDAKVRIAGRSPLHYLVADRSGRVATVEFLAGKMVAHTAESLPVAALTNSTYDASLTALEKGSRGGRSSLGRFVTAAERVQDFDAGSSGDAVAYAFETLQRVSQSSTQWSIVYELDRLRVHFKTRTRRTVRSVQLDRLSFSCAASVKMLDLHRKAAGNVEYLLEPYSAEANLKLVRDSYRKTPFLSGSPANVHERVASHPATSFCQP